MGGAISRIKSGTMLYVPLFGATPNSRRWDYPAESRVAAKSWSLPAQALEVFSPVPGGLYHSPIEIIARTTEANGFLYMRLLDDQGGILATAVQQGGDVDGFLVTSLSYVAPSTGQPQGAVLEFSALGSEGTQQGGVRLPITIAPGTRAVSVAEPTAGVASGDPIRVSGFALAYEGTVVMVAETRFGQRLGRAVAAGGVFDHAGFSGVLNVAAPCSEVLVSVFAPTPSDHRAIDLIRIPVILRSSSATRF